MVERCLPGERGEVFRVEGRKGNLLSLGDVEVGGDLLVKGGHFD